MTTEDIRIEDGRILVERAGNKPNVDVAASDVDSVSFVRGGEAEGHSVGALVLHTKDGDVVIRVADDEAGEALKLVRDAGVGDSVEETEQSVGPAVVDGEPVGAPSNEDNNLPIEQPNSPTGKRRTNNK